MQTHTFTDLYFVYSILHTSNPPTHPPPSCNVQPPALHPSINRRRSQSLVDLSELQRFQALGAARKPKPADTATASATSGTRSRLRASSVEAAPARGKASEESEPVAPTEATGDELRDVQVCRLVCSQCSTGAWAPSVVRVVLVRGLQV
jgi:hypothetical protein